MVGLSGSMFIERLIVYHPVWLSTGFRLHNHPTTPSGWSVDRNFLYNTKTDIHIQSPFDCFLSVERDLGCLVDSNRFGLLVNMEVERG